MILSGWAVQTKGFGSWLASAMKRLMAAWRSTIERKTPRLRRRLVSLAKKLSTALSQEQEVGVKWKTKRGRIGAGHGDDPIDHRLGKRRNARRPRLVAQQAIDAGLHEAFLPAPDHRLALASPPHDRRRPKAIGGHPADPRR